MTVLYLSKMLLLETMLIYSLTFDLHLTIRIDYSASALYLSLFKKIQHGAVSKMENQKATESTGSSNGEIHERANPKTEKTHQKITLPTFEKRGIHEAKL